MGSAGLRADARPPGRLKAADRIADRSVVKGALVLAMWILVQQVPDPSPVMASAIERQRASVIQSMSPGIQRQREAIRLQAATAARTFSSEVFATLAWPEALPPAPPVLADCSPLPVSDVEQLVAENAARERLDPDLLREVMRRESGFRPCAVSRAGAQGLMQLMPVTAQQFRVGNVMNAKENAAAGAKFLRLLLDRYGGDIALALGAYNAGPTRVDQAGGVPEIPETRQYVNSILTAIE